MPRMSPELTCACGHAKAAAKTKTPTCLMVSGSTIEPPRVVLYTIRAGFRAMPRLISLLLLAAALFAADFKVGVAKIDITPTEPIYLSGYAARTHASDGVTTHLFAKALALEDRGGSRV